MSDTTLSVVVIIVIIVIVISLIASAEIDRISRVVKYISSVGIGIWSESSDRVDYISVICILHERLLPRDSTSTSKSPIVISDTLEFEITSIEDHSERFSTSDIFERSEKDISIYICIRLRHDSIASERLSNTTDPVIWIRSRDICKDVITRVATRWRNIWDRSTSFTDFESDSTYFLTSNSTVEIIFSTRRLVADDTLRSKLLNIGTVSAGIGHSWHVHHETSTEYEGGRDVFHKEKELKITFIKIYIIQ